MHSSAGWQMERGKIYIIAEAGVNHNGSFERAIALVDAAVEAGVDCVKFQTFKTELLVSEDTEKAGYQKTATGSEDTQFNMLKSLELSFDDHRKISAYCAQKGIDYCSTPFDERSVELLVEMDVPFWKVPSGEITNLPFLRRITRSPRRVIISTGMAEMFEIAFALKVLQDGGIPKEDIIVLHCNTEYPTPMTDVNLAAMNTIRAAFKVRVGYSDHTLGIEIPVAAAALGAEVIEKHFTLDKSLPGPDHAASLSPVELAEMVRLVRNVEIAMGNGEKQPSSSEKKNRAAARKSIVACKPIAQGEILDETNITVKRPGTGISPIHWDQVVGSIAVKNYNVNELI